ncbi:hypothetical protein GF357_02300 [Candidatus Dojkabacteria bacterium]|nr:hypothetical protein [Candidatus Dojkabacteria bacterium]
MILAILQHIMLFLLGAAISSFLSALAFRIYQEYPVRKMLFQPSHCEKCKTGLKWFELVPILSYILQKGKCRNCGKMISPEYFYAEVFLSGTFLIFSILGVPIINYFVVTMLFFISIFDLLYNQVPRFVMHAVMIMGVIWFLNRVLTGSNSHGFYLDLYFPVVEAFLWAALMSFMNLIKKSFGFADILTILFIGLVSEKMLQPSISFFYGALILAIPSIFFIIIDPAWRKKYVPFLPFLAIGYVVASLAPDGIVFTIVSL